MVRPAPSPRPGSPRSISVAAALACALALGFGALGCPATPRADAEVDAEAGRARADTQPPPAGPAKSPFPPASGAAGDGPEFVAAPAEGEVAEIVVEHMAKAKADQRQLLVYVGASWCEPCKFFHGAVEDGSLDRKFPRLRLLEFDLDRDRDRLIAAGYRSKLIPLFAVPGPDGKPSRHLIEGGVKGPDGVAVITQRLEALLLAAEKDATLIAG